MSRIFCSARFAVVGFIASATLWLADCVPLARADEPCKPPFPDQVYPSIGDVRVFLYDPAKNLDAACNVRANRPVVLRPFSGYEPLLVRMATAGAFFAYVATPDDFDGAFYINSVDLFTGRYAHGISYFPSPGNVSDLVLKANGSIAWIQADTTPRVTVRLADTRGVRVPRNGHDVKAGSLRLRGSHLTWKKNRRKFSTHLY